jgi:hypothetical protein
VEETCYDLHGKAMRGAISLMSKVDMADKIRYPSLDISQDTKEKPKCRPCKLHTLSLKPSGCFFLFISTCLLMMHTHVRLWLITGLVQHGFALFDLVVLL